MREKEVSYGSLCIHNFINIILSRRARLVGVSHKLNNKKIFIFLQLMTKIKTTNDLITTFKEELP